MQDHTRRTALLFFFVFSALYSVAEPRLTAELNKGWAFAFQPASSGIENPNFDDSKWETVSLPHTWNAADGQDGGTYARDDGWYRFRFALPPEWRRRQVFLEVDAANKVTEAWLNGERIGRHEGGYARFRFDLTGKLLAKAPNVLVMRVNNAQGAIAPLHGDFTHFGGLYRGVRLVGVNPVHLAMNDHGSSGVFIDVRDITNEKATVVVRSGLENSGEKLAEVSVRVALITPHGTTAATTTVPVQVPAGQSAQATATLTLSSPELWQGRHAPALYRAEVTVLAGKRQVDKLSESFGVRTLAFDANRGFLLNGTPYPVHGVNRHQDRLDKGYAISDADKREDLALMEEMGVSSVRLCHYQHDQPFYALCDERGMLVWAELAFVGSMVENDTGFAANAVRQLRELIRQNYNHPSIICWSIGNETRKEQAESCASLLKELAGVVKSEDPVRPSTYASHHAVDDPRNFVTPVLAFNKYFGWYSGDYAELGPWLDAFHAQHPDLPIGMSEYGAGASIHQQEQNPPPRPKTQAKGPWHPEQWQSTFHEQAWLTLKDRPYLWGTYIWVMFDFASDGRNEGDTPGRNDKGLVTADRRVRKDAFYWYKANWSTDPFVHITSRRDVLRLERETEVKIYSNCDSVELWVNGASVGRKSSGDHRFVWNNVALAEGPNRIRAAGTKNAATVTDSCAWTFSAGGPYRPAPEAAEPVTPKGN